MGKILKLALGLVIALLVGIVIYTIAQTVVVAFIIYFMTSPVAATVGSVGCGIGFLLYLLENKQ